MGLRRLLISSVESGQMRAVPAPWLPEATLRPEGKAPSLAPSASQTSLPSRGGQMAIHCEPLAFRGCRNLAHPSSAGKAFSSTRVRSCSAQAPRLRLAALGPAAAPSLWVLTVLTLCPSPGSPDSRLPWTWADFPAKGWIRSSTPALTACVWGTHAHAPTYTHTQNALQAASPPHMCWWMLAGLAPRCP